jgi:hypothetical protein
MEDAAPGVGIAALTGMLAILWLLAVLTAGDANRMPRESVLTPDSPSYPVACYPATEADRSRLPTPADPDDRHWTCSLLCFAPMSVTKTAGLLVEREDEDPLLFLDLDQSGRFTPDERFVLSRQNDVILRLPMRESPYAHYPLAIRYSWKHLKSRGETERRTLLQSAFAYAAGDQRVGDERPAATPGRQRP